MNDLLEGVPLMTVPAANADFSPPRPRWVLRPVDGALGDRLSQALHIHPAVGRLMAARGWSDLDAAASFLSPRLRSLRDPFELSDMEPAIRRTLGAIERGEKIAVFGDYDVDGISSTAVMVLALRHLGAAPVFFIPHRIHDGYGMSARRVEELAAEGATLLITVDCGVSCSAEIQIARRLGMDVIITDHHLAEGELPDAHAIVNPNRADAYYEGGRLSGVGVAFKFAHALLKGADRPAEEARDFLKSLMDLVALGTIADVVPLVGENRILAHFGLEVLQNSARPGIQALLEVTGLRGKQLRAEHVGFVLGPRINAAGRTDHAGAALELFLTTDPARAHEIAKHLDMLNRRRREEEASILDHCLAAADQQMATSDDSLLVVAGQDYHLGIVGIVAARLTERFHRPAIVLRMEEELARGSARSIGGFDIHEALCSCHDLLTQYGGHAAAAGVQLQSVRVPDFRGAINEFARGIFAARDLTPEIQIDVQLEPDEFTWKLHRDMQRLQPFGEENPSPLFLIQGVQNAVPPRVVGTNHLKLVVRLGARSVGAIGFGLGEHLALCASGQPYDIVFRSTENHFRGQTNLEMHVVDLRASA